ncbi:MAG: MurR/RpiR family transcriptional regulator [Spirochaetaceae bacterium]|nr:MAG: MurR/RpiR family transcriptional regulator [Spirochaetaceae bacterium]
MVEIHLNGLDNSRAAHIPRECLVRMQSIYPVAKRAERSAVEFLAQNPERVPDLSIVDFAAQAGCSEATVVRLSKRLGYEGFPELKRDFAKSTASVDTTTYSEHNFVYADIGTGDRPLDVLQKVIQATIDGLHDTLNILSYEDYDACVDRISTATRLLFVGLGDASTVALEARQRFLRAGKIADAPLDADTQLMIASRLQAGDVFVGISHSGRSRNVVEAARLAKLNGATVIAITNAPVSPLTKKSDHVLLTAVFTRYLKGELIAKRIAELCIIESLFANYVNRQGAEVVERLRKSEESVEHNKL